MISTEALSGFPDGQPGVEYPPTMGTGIGSLVIETRAGHSEYQPRDARRDDRHHQVACQRIHEQIPETGVHRIQWTVGNPPFLIEHGFA